VSAPLVNVVRYAPHARQLAVHAALEPFVWIMAGYAVGKTTALVHEALSLAAVTHPGYEGIVAAPTFPLLFQSWVTEWKRIVPSTWYALRRDPLFGPYIELRTDQGASKIWLRSTVEARSVEGINAAWLVYDEASRETRRDPINVLLSRVRRGYPGRQRRHVFAGPPQTRSHWTAEMFGAGVDAAHTGDALTWTDGTRRVVRARTRDNPHLPRGYERNLRARPGATKAWCRQWLDAEVGSVEGQIYECFSRDVHVVPAATLAGRKWRAVVSGMDWGWSNPGVFIAAGIDGRGDVYLLREEAHRGKPVTTGKDGWLPLLKSACGDLKVSKMWADPSRPGDIAETGKHLRNVTLVYPADNDVGDGIRAVTAMLEAAVERAEGRDDPKRPALYVSDACPYTVSEFESYVRARQRDGSFSEAPHKVMDHAMDAIRYLVKGATNA